jgi:hypothetical protein
MIKVQAMQLQDKHRSIINATKVACVEMRKLNSAPQLVLRIDGVVNVYVYRDSSACVQDYENVVAVIRHMELPHNLPVQKDDNERLKQE